MCREREREEGKVCVNVCVREVRCVRGVGWVGGGGERDKDERERERDERESGKGMRV